MKKTLFIALGLAIAGLSTTAMSSPEAPTLIETAAFLVTGKKAEEFKQIEGDVLERNVPSLELFTKNLPTSIKFNVNPEDFSNIYEYVGRYTNDIDCGIMHIFRIDKIEKKSGRFLYGRLYKLNKLNGDVVRNIEYISGRRFISEKMIGSNSYCDLEAVGDKLACKELKSDVKFYVEEDSSDLRAKAWEYLFSNHCQTSKQPF